MPFLRSNPAHGLTSPRVYFTLFAMSKQNQLHDTALSRTLTAMRRALRYVFLFSFAINMLSLIMPLYTMQVYDRVFTTRSLDTLLSLTVVVLIGFVFYGAIYAVRAGVIARVLEWMERTLAPQILGSSIEQAAQTGTPYAGQYQRDLMILKNFIAAAAPTVVDIPWSLIFVLVIYMINPMIGFLSLAGIVLLCVSAFLNEYATRKALMRAQERSVSSALTADIIGRNADAICAMGMNAAVTRHWQTHNERGLVLQDIAQSRSAVISGITRSLRMLLQILVMALGAWLALNGQLSSGGLIAASILAQRALTPFDQAIMLWKQFIGARDAYNRLHKLLETIVPPAGNTALPTPAGRLTAEGLYLTFGKGQPTLRNISFDLAAGESLGIIGPSAAGKSTLAKAIAGVFKPTYGTVRLDGAEIFQWGRTEVGQHMGYLPQQVELFGGTIKQNIARLNENFTDAAVIEAAQKAGVHNLILQFEHGYDTVYEPGNTILSPGQKQRIGLARALYGNPRLVILDEPNSNLDGDGERALMHSLNYLRRAKVTTVIVAHRPSILSTVDKVMVLRAGAIDAIGPREEVLARFQPRPRIQESGDA